MWKTIQKNNVDDIDFSIETKRFLNVNYSNYFFWDNVANKNFLFPRLVNGLCE